MKSEILFLSGICYTTILVLMAVFLLIGCKPNENYGQMVKKYIRDLLREKNVIGVIYSVLLFLLTLPLTIILLLIHLIKSVIIKCKKG